MRKSVTYKLLWTGLLLLFLAGCSQKQSASSAVEDYLQALVNKDAAAIDRLVCSQWETEARQDLESFSAVSTTLEGLKCQETGQDGQNAAVTCSGKIVANYSGENQVFDLSGRTYFATQEGGGWRMCSYR